MSKIDRETVVPYPKDWYNRPKYQPVDGSHIAFLLGILVLAGIIVLAVITPVIIAWIVKVLMQNGPGVIPGMNTQFQINGQTYDTAAIVTDLFKGNISKYGITAP
jgi:hypothetical protein